MRYRFQHRGTEYDVSLERQEDEFLAAINGQKYRVEVLEDQPGEISLRLEGENAAAGALTVYWGSAGMDRWFSLDGCTYRIEKPAAHKAGEAGAASGRPEIRAPMPAQVRAVSTLAGDVVEAGATLLLLEAMKMEIRVRAPVAGKVRRMLVAIGQTVEKDQLLVEMEA